MFAEDRDGRPEGVYGADAVRPQVYRFDGFELDPLAAALTRNGETVHLRNKTFQVLLFLIDQRHRCVTKQELWAQVWADSAVTDDALVQCVKDIRRALQDDVRNPKYIKTIARVGYRFVAALDESPVVVPPATTAAPEPEAAAVEPERAAPIVAPVPAKKPRRAAMFALAASVAIAAIAAPFVFRGRQADASAAVLPNVPGKTSVMVTYMDSDAVDEDSQWLRQGLADMLISGLARSERLTVLPRQQLDLLLDRHADGVQSPLPLERALVLAGGARAEALVTGTFTRHDSSLRLDVQIHDAASGRILATDHLEAAKPEEILSQVDLLSMRIASALGSPAVKNATLPEVMTDNLEAYRAYSLAIEKGHGLENKDAVELLERAIALDPGFAMAHARIGYTYAVLWGRTEDAKPYLQKAFNLSSRLTPKDRMNIAAWYAIANYDYAEAIRLYRQIILADAADVEAHVRLAKLLNGERDYRSALEVASKGLALDPNSPELHNLLAGIYLDGFRQHDRAIEFARKYVALAPKEPNAYDTLALNLLATGDYRGAAAELEKALALNPNFDLARVHLANTYVREGRYASAAAEYRRYLDVAPSLNEQQRGTWGLAEIARRQGRWREARVFDVRWAKLAGFAPWSDVLAAIERNDRAVVERARQQLDTHLASNRGQRANDRNKLYHLGVIALKTGQHDEALRLFREVIGFPLTPWDIDDFETGLGDALLELGRTKEAVAAYERVLRSYPNYAAARLGLAQALERNGDATAAAREYRRFLEIWKTADRDAPAVLLAQRKLAK